MQNYATIFYKELEEDLKLALCMALMERGRILPGEVIMTDIDNLDIHHRRLAYMFPDYSNATEAHWKFVSSLKL